MLMYSLAFSDKREQYTEGLIMQKWHHCSYLWLTSHSPLWPTSLAPFTKGTIRSSQESMAMTQPSAVSSQASVKGTELKCGLKDREEVLPKRLLLHWRFWPRKCFGSRTESAPCVPGRVIWKSEGCWWYDRLYEWKGRQSDAWTTRWKQFYF